MRVHMLLHACILMTISHRVHILKENAGMLPSLTMQPEHMLHTVCYMSPVQVQDPLAVAYMALMACNVYLLSRIQAGITSTTHVRHWLPWLAPCKQLQPSKDGALHWRVAQNDIVNLHKQRSLVESRSRRCHLPAAIEQ